MPPESKQTETKEVPDLQTGSVIDGKYEILGVIGKGGMGTVYRARHRFIQKDVAVKMLHPHFSDAEQVVQRFEREAMTSARLEHPNICAVTDSGRTPDSQLYIIMELIEGRSLQKIIADEAPLPVGRIMSITRQICSALEKAHEKKVIHRDLKPENIMVSQKEDGTETIKIMDFGIAKATLDDAPATQLTTAGMVFGTPHYISPEQASGDPVDGRSDLYSLGCMLYEMAKGARPYEADTVGMLLRKHVTGKIPEILPSGESGPMKLKRLSDLVRRLMAKNPDDRPSTARDVTELLDKIDKEEVRDESIATAATLIVEKGEVEAARFAQFAKEISLSLLTFKTSKARSRAEGLMESILVPWALRVVAWVRKYPIALTAWLLVVLLVLAGLGAILVTISSIALGDGEEPKEEVAPPVKKKPADTLPTKIKIEDAGTGGKGAGAKEPAQNGAVDIEKEVEKALGLAQQGKSKDALVILEKLTPNIGLMSQSSFLFHLAVLRSKAGHHQAALDAVERCIVLQKSCADLPPIQEAMLSALWNDVTTERASRLLASHATQATIDRLEGTAREDGKKSLRTAAFTVLKEGNFLDGFEPWSRLSILFVNEAKCKKKKDYLKQIREEGDPRALPALKLFSSGTGCGFLGLGDCYRCFRSDLDKTIKTLKEKEEPS